MFKHLFGRKQFQEETERMRNEYRKKLRDYEEYAASDVVNLEFELDDGTKVQWKVQGYAVGDLFSTFYDLRYTTALENAKRLAWSYTDTGLWVNEDDQDILYPPHRILAVRVWKTT